MEPFDEARQIAERLMELPGVVLVGEGVDESGERSIVVVVSDDPSHDPASIPDEINGYSVEVSYSDPIVAQPENDTDEG